MSILNTVESMATSHSGPEYQSVASALMAELEQSSTGTSGLLQSFQRNGMGAFAEQWVQGNTQPNPTSIEGGLAGTDLVERIAERTGLSTGVVRCALAVIVPILIHHVVSNRHISPTGEVLGDQPEPDSLLQSVLSRIG